MRAELLGMDGTTVAIVEIPTWEPPPEAVLWTGRLFVRDPCNHYRFREGVTFYASTAELFELKREASSSRCSRA